MTGRYLPPAYSPLTLGALVGGATASILGRPGVLSQEIQRRYHSSRVVLCDSGTSALALALGSASDGGTPLIGLPAYGCYDLVSAALAVSAEVVFYDLDPETLAPDPDSFARMLDAGPRAVVAAYLYGMTFDTVALRRQVEQAGAVLVEDAAQAFGASLRGNPCGGLGTVGVLSFGRGKGVTGGGGGALLVGDAQVAVAEPLGGPSGWPGWGKALVQWALARPAWYRLPAALPFLRLGETVYHAPRQAGRMAGINQAVLYRLLTEADREAEVRRRNGRRLAGLLANSARAMPIKAQCGEAGYLRFPVLTSSDAFRTEGARRLGVMPGYPMALDRLPAIMGHVRQVGSFPGAKRLADELVTLPTHSLVNEGDLDGLEALAS